MANYNFKPVNLDSVKDIIKSKGLYTRTEMEHFDRFNRLGYLDTHNVIDGTREFIFITRPDLHLFSNGSTSTLNPQLADGFFEYCKDRYPQILQSLQSSCNSSINSPFINILTDRVRNTLDLPSIASGDSETGSNIYGDSITYRTGSGSAYTKHKFTLEFDDTRFMDIYMLFKIWDTYCDKKYKGSVSPPKDSYTINKILHDQVSAYKIIVDSDQTTILFFAKLWGVYPTETPLSTYSNLEAGIVKHNVEFYAEFVEDSDPIIIDEFNALGNNYSGVELPIYNSSLKEFDGRWVKMPFIKSGTLHGRKVYKLGWRV